MRSLVNFCENDIYLYGIGEPYNVISSLFISLFGICGLIGEKVKRYQILYTLLLLIGLGSVYFHSELTEFSHWVDIILISCILVFSLWCIDDNKNIISYTLFFMLHIITSILFPVFHLFILFITGFIIHSIISHKIINLGNTFLIMDYVIIRFIFYLSIVFWIIDYVCCEYISPYHTHWIFHILIGYVAFKIIYLSKYL
jgi:hypothetical protein